MSNEIAKTGIPAWMKAASTGAKIGNVDSSDLKPPRLKILAGQSPEVMDGVPDAVPGNFWLTIFNKNLGKTVVGTPILLKKSYQLWHPRVAGRANEGPLASASDGVNWDTPNQTFVVTFPPNEGGGTETWKIGRRVDEGKMGKFGSSRPGDPRSKPAATLTYDTLWMIDMPNGAKPQMCVFTSSRTGITQTQNFVSTLEAMGVDHYFQRYAITVVKKQNKTTSDSYFTFDYQFDSTIEDEAQGQAMKALYERYAKTSFVTDFDQEAADIATARNTEGTRRDFSAPDPREADEEIPY